MTPSLIGRHALSAAQSQAARTTLAGHLSRAGVADQLQAFGVSPQDAQARVAALSDAEVTALAGRLDSLPAGADVGIPLLILAAFFFWRFFYSDQAKAEAAKKPAPAPEKK